MVIAMELLFIKLVNDEMMVFQNADWRISEHFMIVHTSDGAIRYIPLTSILFFDIKEVVKRDEKK